MPRTRGASCGALDGRAVRWREHNDERRRALIAAAVELIEQGEREPSLAAIGARAGVSRSVVYRDFADRDDLDRALQTEILDRLWRELLPAMRLEGTFYAALERIIRTYVDWAVAHPRLHQRVDHDTAVDGDGPLQKVLDLVAERVAELLVTTFTALGAEVTDNDRLATDPLVHGLVGSVFSAVRRWVHLGSKVPDAAHLSEVLTEATWAVLSARAASYGFELRPDHDLAVLVGARGGSRPSARGRLG